MAEDDRSGEEVRQHVRRMLVRLAARERKRANEQKNPLRSVSTAVKVEGEENPPPDQA
jgi:hypothetical protein